MKDMKEEKKKYPCENCEFGTYMTVEGMWWCDKHLMYDCQMEWNRGLCEKFKTASGDDAVSGETIKMLEGAFRDAKECEPKDSKEDILDRYLILLGPNTRQWWIYDEVHDTYIDPPADVLQEIQDDRSFTRVNGVLKDAFESEEMRLRRIVSEDPDWLKDVDHWYSNIEI